MPVKLGDTVQKASACCEPETVQSDLAWLGLPKALSCSLPKLSKLLVYKACCWLGTHQCRIADWHIWRKAGATRSPGSLPLLTSVCKDLQQQGAQLVCWEASHNWSQKLGRMIKPNTLIHCRTSQIDPTSKAARHYVDCYLACWCLNGSLLPRPK